MEHEAIGVWFIGARGSLATTATLGALALASGRVPPIGCVTELDAVDGRGLPAHSALLVGGHDVAELPMAKRAEQLVAGGAVPAALVEAYADELDAADARVRAGVTGAEPDQPAVLGRLVEDLREFRAAHRLRQVVVVDVSSTEPPHDPGPDGAGLDALEAAWAAGRTPLTPSSLYAAAALLADCPYVGFTPSPGITVPALAELAERRSLPYAGCDGKTGETLVKSVLAPMFATRALPVRSWTSVNLLGGGDGATLADPVAARSKTETKRRGLEAMLGGPVSGPMHIDYVEDLGDWKTAWDHVRFDGFLGVGMTLQFTWQGCDSVLAAPLVLDLVRLLARAQDTGAVGPQAELGFFFKDPLGTDEHRLAAQWDDLLRWSTACGDRWAEAAAR
jgi:myo-inositol-1-phosphate synthase